MTTSRGSNDHLTDAEITLLLLAFQNGESKRLAAQRVNCSFTTAKKYWADFRAGWKPGQQERLRSRHNETDLTGPVAKKPKFRPNCMPGLELKIMRGRA